MMNAQTPAVGMRFSQVWRAWTHQLIDIVPEEIACCEFDCRKAECHLSEWAACKRRLAYVTKSHTPCAPCEAETALDD
jgi:hypothetical protein